MPESIPFYPLGELSRTAVYTIPALALIWYMVLHKKSIGGKIALKPSLTDLRQFLLGFPALVLTGVVLSFLMTRFSVLLPPKVEAPGSAFAWVVMAVSCAGTGYLEESFFRFYLLKKTEEWSSGRLARIIFSVVLFAVCHFYEGPWGILNAVIAGVILALLFERHKTLHGIAWAHGAYNAFVYVMGIFA